MSEKWIVDLGEGERQTVEATELTVEAGNLIARQWDKSVAAWAPGVWTRFWPQPVEYSPDGRRITLAAFKVALNTATDERTMAWLETRIALIEFALAQDERQAA